MDNPQRTHWIELLSERELKEVQFSELYDANFQHGTSGHIAYMLISKLTSFLNTLQKAGINVKSLVLGDLGHAVQHTDEEWLIRANHAYDAYAESTGGKTYDGRQMPTWLEIGEKTPHVQRAWVAAVKRVYRDLDVRESDNAN